MDQQANHIAASGRLRHADCTKTCRYGRTSHAPRFRCQFRHFARQRIHSSSRNWCRAPKGQKAQAPLPFSAPTLWRKVKAGTFPKPIKLSDRVTAWKWATCAPGSLATAQRNRRGAEAMVQRKRRPHQSRIERPNTAQSTATDKDFHALRSAYLVGLLLKKTSRSKATTCTA